MTRATTPDPINLAKLVAPLPELILPNGATVAMRPLSADGFERFRRVQQALRDAMAGRDIDDTEIEADIDACLALVLPDATREDLASFGLRTELKLTVLTAAAGRVDAVLHAVAQAVDTVEGNAGGATRSKRSPRSTTSARR